ncbi:MAG TPA: MG2 domain-containing protein, partial [Candidatus Limnocylindrales bacterium]|nr:MG2 domain-containing protein [Candidatus Limnocylindrales bacterium]
MPVPTRPNAILVRVIVLVLLFSSAAHAAPYFSLSTDKTFSPGDKIRVHLYSRDVSALEFRLYRVNDPVLFFEQLRDIHGFGTGRFAGKEQIEEKTLVERFHDWKRRQWMHIRNFFREQFSDASRAEIREARGRANKNASPAALFAQVPVLNSSQLVARWRQEMPRQYFSERQDVPVESLTEGAYVVEATDGTLRAYTILMVSKLALVTKSAPGQVLFFSVDRRTGEPVPATQVEIWADHKKQASVQTDAQGTALLTVSTEHQNDTRIFAVHGKDVAVVAPEYFNLSSDPAADWMGYIYTDRPVYRPGHTVHFKAILRRHSGEKYSVPSGAPVQVAVEDPTGKQVYQTSATVSSFGSIHADFTLAQDAALGYYSISVKSGAATYGMNGGFNVEEYKKPEYEVRVTPDKARVLEGESVSATIEAKYFFGEPVAGAEVHYVVHRSPYWSSVFEYDGDDFDYEGEGDEPYGGSDDQPAYDYGGEQLSEQTGKLDANGRLRISIPTTVNEHKRDYRYRVEARVTDASRREIAGYNSVIATYGSFRIGAQPDKYMYQPNEAIRVTGQAKDYDGNPVQTAFHVELLRHDYRSREDTVIESQDGQTDKNGQAMLQFTARQSGSITVRIKAKTPEGREIQSDAWLWVPGDGGVEWAQTSQVQIIADKKSYKPGETAHLMVLTNVPQASLLVTTEGRTIQSRQVVKASGPSTMVNIPIGSDNQPNFYVAAVFVRDNTLYTGSKNLKVPAEQARLNITIEPSQPQFRPGDPARYTITARDFAGKPVAGEFSLGVVDEAIYAVHPDSVADIKDFFYGQVANQVMAQSSLSFYFTGEAGTKPMILAFDGKRRGLRLAQIKPSEPLVQPKVRKLFPDTALWLADLRTDQNGRAQAQLNFPDSLTTWRATVRGATMDTKVGSATNRVIVRKNLMVRLAAPRFFRQGDDVTVSTIVHNYLTSDKTAQVSLEAKGLDLQESGPKQVTVATKADQRTDWHAHAGNVHEATLTAKALTNEESDALEQTLPVIPFGVKLSDSKSGAVTSDSGQDQATVNLPGDPATASPALNVSVSPSIAGSIFGALDYLTSYPYGCTEQTMSGFLPDIVVARAMKDLKLESTINTPELEKKIRAGLERLYDFQHDDGGWGWWKEDESMVFMTAYVVSGLAQARDAGYDVNGEKLKNAENWLKGQLKQHERMRADLRAYVVYALELDKAGDAAMLDDAYKARNDMSSQGLSMLGLALHAASDGRAREIATLVEKEAVVEGAEAHWPSQYDYFLEFYIDDSAE